VLISYKRGQGSVILRVKILNSSVTTGAGLTGLTSASAGLIISTIADNEATATAYTQAGSTIETIATLGTYAAPTATKCRFKEVDATNHPGVYEIQLADARLAVASAKSLLVSISGATNCAETDAVIPLTDLDPYDGLVQTEWADGGRLDLLIDAIPTTAMRGTDSANTTVPDAAGTASTLLTALESHGDSAWATATAVTADLTHIGGQAISGNNATLKLKQLDIQNSAGSAVIAKSTGGNGHGLEIAGNGTGEGIYTLGGATGHGLYAQGGSTSGDGIRGTAQDGDGNGMYLEGDPTSGGTGAGLRAKGGNFGHGLYGSSGSNEGKGAYFVSVSGIGMHCQGGGTNAGIYTEAGLSGAGFQCQGGSVGGVGIRATAVAANANAISLAPHGTGVGIYGNLSGTIGGFTAAAKAEIESEANDALVALNLDHLMKTAVANNADMTTEVPDGTVLSNLMTKTGDTSDYVLSTDSLEGAADVLATATTIKNLQIERHVITR